MEIIVELDDPFLVGFDTEEKVVDDSMGPWPNSKNTTIRGDVLDQTDHSQAGRKEGFVGRGVRSDPFLPTSQ